MPRRVPQPLRVRNIEARYGANITTLLEPFKEQVEKEVFPILEFITEAQPKLDSAGDETRRIFDNIKAGFEFSFSDKAIDQLARRSAEMIDSTNFRSLKKQFNSVLGVDPFFSEPWLAEETDHFVHENASLIKTIPNEHLSDIEQMVFREAKRGASPQEIRKKIQEQFKLADNQAALIARDQVSKFNGRLSELRQQAAGVTEYIWRTSEDGRVRTLANSSGYSSHARLNGEKFSWKNPPITVFKGKRAGERNHPGQDINCRCYAEPVLKRAGRTAGSTS